MPTVKDLIAELKQLGVRGYSKKLKGELVYMLVAAKKAKGEVKKPEPIKIAIKDIREKRAKPKIGTYWMMEEDYQRKKEKERLQIKREKEQVEYEEYMKNKPELDRIEREKEEEQKKAKLEELLSKLGGVNGDHWMTSDFEYDLAHNKSIYKTDDLYYVKVLKEKIYKWQHSREPHLDTPRMKQFAKRMDNALIHMLKENGRKQTISVQTVRNTLQPFFTHMVHF